MTYPKLQWQKCKCGSPHCQRLQPVNFGFFYQGSGFSPEEREIIDNAFRRANDAARAEDELSRLRYPDNTGQ